MKSRQDISYEILISTYAFVVARYQELFGDTLPEKEKYRWLYGQKDGVFHGVDHWVRVGIYALAIAEHLRNQGKVNTPCISQAEKFEQAVLYATFFHDCARFSEDAEPDHGRSANKVWLQYSGRKGLAKEITEVISQALLFHVDHDPVDPKANEVTVCLCNADRLDRVRLGARPKANLMYDDGIWDRLKDFSDRLLSEVNLKRVKRDLDAT